MGSRVGIQFLGIVALVGSLGGVSGCVRATVEAAPLRGGEMLTYQIDAHGGMYMGTVAFEKTADGFVLDGRTPGFPPERVGPDLADGRKMIQTHYLGRVWLPPSQRHVGAETMVGPVLELQASAGRPSLVVRQRNGVGGVYHFDLDTGFLTRLESSIGGQAYRVHLQSSTIPGLRGAGS
jgi:hypothetical protein